MVPTTSLAWIVRDGLARTPRIFNIKADRRISIYSNVLLLFLLPFAHGSTEVYGQAPTASLGGTVGANSLSISMLLKYESRPRPRTPIRHAKRHAKEVADCRSALETCDLKRCRMCPAKTPPPPPSRCCHIIVSTRLFPDSHPPSYLHSTSPSSTIPIASQNVLFARRIVPWIHLLPGFRLQRQLRKAHLLPTCNIHIMA
ncbi:hypothetical protein CC78DRAFT_576901 [Lojkania enalia]|uniref:Uncharacterized protein n=1 Tax=Lojkania enalia TaxID=147567 RepID=A0A9P4KE46_9PLEO|nr:hypothetical protein CC78DRAFT_576901 [Didymosphaeria enalia]